MWGEGWKVGSSSHTSKTQQDHIYICIYIYRHIYIHISICNHAQSMDISTYYRHRMGTQPISPHGGSSQSPLSGTAASFFSHHGQFGPYRLLCTSSPVKILCHLKAYWKTVSVDGITNCFPLLLGPCSANTNRNSESNPWQLKQDQVISGVV